MREYYRKPNIAKSYSDMFERKSEKQLQDESVYKHSEFKKPYESDSYDDMEQMAQPSFSFPQISPPGWDFPGEEVTTTPWAKTGFNPGNTNLSKKTGTVAISGKTTYWKKTSTVNTLGKTTYWKKTVTTTKTILGTTYYSHTGGGRRGGQWSGSNPVNTHPPGGYKSYYCFTNGCFQVGSVSNVAFHCTFPPGDVSSWDKKVSGGGGMISVDDRGGTSRLGITVSVNTPGGSGTTDFGVEACPEDTCKGDDGNPTGIGYTSQQMSTGGSQTFTVSNPKTGKTYTWEVGTGGGSIDGSGNYTAPSSNANCAGNPTINLKDGDTVCGTLNIAVNAAATGYAGYLCCNYECPWIVCRCFNTFNCNGVLVNQNTCTAGCMEKGSGANGSSCAGLGLDAGITDIRTDAQKAAGCCPSQLL